MTGDTRLLWPAFGPMTEPPQDRPSAPLLPWAMNDLMAPRAGAQRLRAMAPSGSSLTAVRINEVEEHVDCVRAKPKLDDERRETR